MPILNQQIWATTYHGKQFALTVLRKDMNSGVLELKETATNDILLNRDVKLTNGDAGPGDILAWDDMAIDAIANNARG